MTPLEELAVLLKPAGGGIYVVSTGKSAQLEVQNRLYDTKTEDQIETRFREALGRIKDARVLMLGIPSDVGASYRRGANLGPQAIRAQLLEEDPTWPQRMQKLGVV